MTDPELDTAIDRAVRDLMNVDADPAFRARVADRLRRRPRGPLSLRLMTAAAAVAVIVLALVWGRQSPPKATAPGPIARVEAPASAVPQARGATAAHQPVSRRTVPSRRVTAVRNATASIPARTLATADADMPGTPIAPLTAMEAITVDPIVSASIVPVEIVVAPLSPIAELEMSPLEPRAARD